MIKKLRLVLVIMASMTLKVEAAQQKDRDSINLSPSPQHSLIAVEVVNALERFGYKKVPLQDSLSEIIFNNLLGSMDHEHYYLLESDMLAISSYKHTFCQNLKSGHLDGAFHMYNLIMNRYQEALEYALAQVDEAHDFSVDENLIASREKLPYFTTENELKNYWRKRVKYDLLSLLEYDNSPARMEKQKSILKKRYENIIMQSNQVNANDAFQVIMKAFTDAIDPHLVYYNPSFAQSFKEKISKTMQGIGVRMVMQNEVLTIQEIIVGGPAYKDKNLHVNDRIIAVAQGDGAFEDIIGWRQDASIAKIKGPQGSIVQLKIIPAGFDLHSTPKIVKLSRQKIVLTEESAKKEIKEVKGSDGKSYKIGIIRLPMFYIDYEAYSKKESNYKSSMRDVRLILDSLRLEQVDAVVLDLRNNGGGALQEAIGIAGLFIDTGSVVQMRNLNNSIEVGRDRNAGMAWNGPLGVLINRFSASASEILAGFIQDYGRGVIIGSSSYGKGTIQSPIDLTQIANPQNIAILNKIMGNASDGGKPQLGQLNITTGKFYRVTGNSTQLKGVTPDIVFPSQFDGDQYGERSFSSALPWDKIAASNFGGASDLTKIKMSLNALHASRMKKSPGYDYLRETIINYNQLNYPREVSLQIDSFKKNRKVALDRNRSRINKFLKASGMPVWEQGTPAPDIKLDFVLDEGLNVMADYIKMTQKSSQFTFVNKQSLSSLKK